jgi:hypothetical protein
LNCARIARIEGYPVCRKLLGEHLGGSFLQRVRVSPSAGQSESSVVSAMSIM